MKRLIAFLLVCMLAACIFSGCRDEKNTATPDEGVDTVETPTEEELKTYDIPTKIATLKYPERWKDIVDVETLDTEPYTVTFSAFNGVKVFELFFNGTQGDLLGTLITDDGQYLVTTNMVTVNTASENYETYRNIQEDVNIIMDCLAEDYTFVYGVDVREEDVEVYAISTVIGDLYYPVKWQDRVTVDVSDSRASFSCGETPLFDIMFGGTEGNLIGQLNGMDILIVDYPLEDEEMKNMQEDVNVILTYLQKDDGFVLV